MCQLPIFFSRGTFLEFSNSKNSVVDSKYIYWIKHVTPIFKNFASKVHSIGSIAKLSLFVSSPLVWWGFRVLLELIQSDHGFALLTKFVLEVWSKKWLLAHIFYLLHGFGKYIYIYLVFGKKKFIIGAHFYLVYGWNNL